MVATVTGQRGQNVVHPVGVVLAGETDHVIVLNQVQKDTTAPSLVQMKTQKHAMLKHVLSVSIMLQNSDPYIENLHH